MSSFNRGIIGIMLMVFSILGLLLHILWIFEDEIPITIKSLMPAKIYRYVVPGSFIGLIIGWLSFVFVKIMI